MINITAPLAFEQRGFDGMKVNVIIAFYKRHELTSICFDHLKRQKDKFGFNVFVAGSELKKSRDLAHKFGFGYIETKNTPVSQKNNSLLKSAKDLKSDLVVMLGSDDFVNDQFFEEVYKLDPTKEVIYGYNAIHFYRTKDKKLTFFTGYRGSAVKTIGAGRIYTKATLRKCNYKLWSDHKNTGLDTDAATNARARGCKEVILENEKVFMLDVKHSLNISSPKLVDIGESVPKLKMFNELGEKTYKKINALVYQSGNDQIINEKNKQSKSEIMEKVKIEIIQERAGMQVGETRTIEKHLAKALINRGVAKLYKKESKKSEPKESKGTGEKMIGEEVKGSDSVGKSKKSTKGSKKKKTQG